MSVAQIGVLMSLVPVMRIFGPSLWGWMADRSGRRARTLRITACGSLLSFSLLFFADSYLQLVAVMLLLNLFTSAQSPLMEALMLGEMRGDLSSYGRLRLWGSIGFIAAVVAAGFVFDRFGMQALLAFCCVLLAAVVAAGLRIGDGPPAHATHAKPPLWAVLRKPEVASFFLSAALMCGAHMALYTFLSLYLEREGYSKAMTGAMWAAGVVAEVAFFYYQAPLFARFGARRVMMLAFALAVLRFAVTGAAPGALWLMVTAQLLHAVTFAAHHSASVQTMQRWFAGPLQASGQALYMSLGYGVGASAGGLLLTACWDRIGPQQMYYVASSLCAAGGAAAWYSFRRQAAEET